MFLLLIRTVIEWQQAMSHSTFLRPNHLLPIKQAMSQQIISSAKSAKQTKRRYADFTDLTIGCSPMRNRISLLTISLISKGKIRKKQEQRN